jgi:hypothetical protein
MLRKAAVIWLIGLFLAPAAHASSGADPALGEWPEWPHRVSCLGHISFDPIAVFSGPINAERGPLPVERALRRELHGSMNWIPRHNWRLGGHKPGYVEFFHGFLDGEYESGRELDSIAFRRREGHWRMQSYDQPCYLWTQRHGQIATSWLLAGKQPPLTPGTRRIHIYVGGRCSRHEKPPVLAGKPEFTEYPSKLVMTIWLRPQPVDGARVCEPGLRPGPAVTIELPEPLGDRKLFDGGDFPPQPATRYERPTVVGL